MTTGAWISAMVCVLCLLCSRPIQAVSLEELREDDRLTPERFARYFRNFDYVYGNAIQSPDVFLFTEAGDCDDFATLADMVLTEKGYSTRLISVRMPGLNHVVCYIAESKGYIDFNNRGFLFRRTVKCRDSLEAIASKVARSFQADWTSVSEFTYRDRSKYLVKTVVKASKYLDP